MQEIKGRQERSSKNRLASYGIKLSDLNSLGWTISLSHSDILFQNTCLNFATLFLYIRYDFIITLWSFRRTFTNIIIFLLLLGGSEPLSFARLG